MCSPLEVAPGYWSGVPGKEGAVPMAELAESAIRMHPMFDPAVLGASLCGRLVYSTAACESLLVHDGWPPEQAEDHVASISIRLAKGWPDFM